MKKIILITIISLVIFSCQKDHIDKPITMIDSTKIEPPLPIINISYSILDSGYVQFSSKTQNMVYQRWRADYLNSYSNNPLFRFTKNGKYQFFYLAGNVLGSNNVFKDTSFTIEIKNAVRLDKDRIISGIVFGDSIKFVSDNNDQLQNFLRSTWPFGFAPYPPTVIVEKKDISLYIAIADEAKEPGVDVASMRKLYTKGIKNLQKQNESNGSGIPLKLFSRGFIIQIKKFKMKNFAQHILFFLLILLLSCNKDNIKETSNVLSPGFAFQEIDGKGIFINESSKNAIYYELTIGNDTLIKGQIKDTLGVYHFKFNGKYEVKLLVENLEGYEITMTKTIQINNIKQDTTQNLNSNSDTTLLKPEINVTYTLLDSGAIQFYNNTKNIKDIEWMRKDESSLFSSREISPKFFYETNGVKDIYLRIRAINESDTTVHFKIEIKNSLNLPKFNAHLKGIYFNEYFDVDGIGSNNFYGLGYAVLPLGTPSINFNFQNQLITIADFFKNQGLDYKNMKENLHLGEQPLLNYDSQKENGLLIIFPFKNNHIHLGMNLNDTCEILEITEVFQLKLIPEMENKAFIITYKLKGDFKDFGKLDCILKVKYIIYKEYLQAIF